MIKRWVRECKRSLLAGKIDIGMHGDGLGPHGRWAGDHVDQGGGVADTLSIRHSLVYLHYAFLVDTDLNQRGVPVKTAIYSVWRPLPLLPLQLG